MLTTYRIDDKTWSYRCEEETPEGVKEIRLSMPSCDTGEDRYELLESISKVFRDRTQPLTRDLFRKGLVIDVDGPSIGIRGTWKISSAANSSIIVQLFWHVVHHVKQAIPFFREEPRRDLIEVEVARAPKGKVTTLCNRVMGVANKVIPRPLETRISDLGPIPLPPSWDAPTDFPLFGDPFTRIASIALQRYEGPFVSELANRGDYHYVLQEDGLTLRRNNAGPMDPKENRVVVQSYINYVIAEFGAAAFSKIQLTYDLDLAGMLERGDPLFPDHVAKFNTIVNNIGMDDVETLWKDLLQTAVVLPTINPKMSLSQAWKILQDKSGHIFPGKIRRHIEHLCPNVGNFLEFLQWLSQGKKTVFELPHEQSNALIEILMSTEEELERAFTGRKICHLAITGTPTMGSQTVENPHRNLFDLLHLFPQLRQRNDWENFFELIAHVFAKKSDFNEVPPTENRRNAFWHVGMIVPGPTLGNGKRTYFYTKSVIDDARGCFSYVLEPVTREARQLDGKPLPFLKIYRSTNSDPNAPHWYDSVLADLNPKGSPGEASLGIAFKYEHDDFDKRTIPLWVGHLVYATNYDGPGKQELFVREITAAYECLLEYLDIAEPSVKQSIRRQYEECLQVQNWDALKKALWNLAEYFQERPSDKIAEDLYFTGHSLGGGLAQLYTWYYTCNRGRIPVPGCVCHCVAYNSTAIDCEHNEEFLTFGRENRELLSALQSRFHVKHQFEFGDFVPEGGSRHIAGSSKKVDDTAWLDFESYIFTPLPTAQALPILTLVTHGRRIGMTVRDIDYTSQPLSATELHEFDSSWHLDSDLKDRFGYRILVGPKASECARKSIGALLYYPMRILRPFVDHFPPGGDEHGVVAASYKHPF